MPTADTEIETLASQEYKYGFVSDVESDTLPPGLSEETVRFISAKKNEPQWLLDWRLKAFRHWQTMTEPHHWGKLKYSPIDYQATSYFSAPKKKLKSLDEVDPELLAIYEKLGVPIGERKKLAGVEEAESTIAVDAVFDSVSVTTTFKKKLGELGII